MAAQAGVTGPAGITDWSLALEKLLGRIAHRFARERVGRYLSALLQRVVRKNGWQLTEAIERSGRMTPTVE